MKNKLNTGSLASDAIAFAKMSEDDFSFIYSEFENLPRSLKTVDDFYQILLEKDLLNGEEIAAGDFIVYVVYELANRGDKLLVELFEHVIMSVKRESEKTGESEEWAEILTHRIELLSQLPSIISSIKASFLVNERDRTLISSKIITDMRPIFENGVNTTSFLILNTIALEYQEHDKKTSIQIAVDLDDIDNIISQLERAKKKSESIKSAISPSGLSIIE